MKKYSKDFIQYSNEKVKDETKSLMSYFLITIPLYIVLLFFLIFFAWYTVFISTHRFYAVSGPSMKPILNAEISDNDKNTANDAVYVDKISSAKLFDIIVIEKPNSSSVIKRLMAQEGDYITIGVDEGHYYFYRIPKDADLETFSDEEAKLNEESGELGYHIRGYEDWWMSYNTADISGVVEISTDKGIHSYEMNFYETFLADFGQENAKYEYFVSESGLVYVKVPDNQFFYMGDNRGHSTDARERGFCDEKYIVGRCEFIVYDFNFGNRLWEVVKFYFKEMEEFFAR